MTSEVRKEIRMIVEHLPTHAGGRCTCPEMVGAIQGVFNAAARDARDEHEGAIPLSDWISLIENASLDGALFTFYADPHGKYNQPFLHYSGAKPFSLRIEEVDSAGGTISVGTPHFPKLFLVAFEYDQQMYAESGYRPVLSLLPVGS